MKILVSVTTGSLPKNVLESKSNDLLNPESSRPVIPKEIKLSTPRASANSLSLKPAPILAINTSQRISSNVEKGKAPLPVEPLPETRQSVATAFGSTTESSASLRETAINSRSSLFKDGQASVQSNSSENIQEQNEILHLRISSSNLSGLADRLKQNSATINVFDSKSPEILNVFNDSASPNTSVKPKAIRTLADVPMFNQDEGFTSESSFASENSRVPIEVKRGSILLGSDLKKGDSRRKSVSFNEPPPESAGSPIKSPPITQPRNNSPTDSLKSDGSGNSKASSSAKGSDTSKSTISKSIKSNSSKSSKVSSSANTKYDEDDEILGAKLDRDDNEALGKRYSKKIETDSAKILKKKKDKSEIHKKKHQSYIPPGFQVQKPKREDKPRKPKIIETEDGDLANIDKDLIEKRIQKRQSQKKLVSVPQSPLKTTVIPPTIVKETNFKTQAIYKGFCIVITLLYLVSFFSIYKNVVQAQQSFYDMDYKISDTLMLSSATFSLLQAAIYWGYYFFIQKDVFIGVGFNLPLILMFVDLAISSVEITKITSIFPPIFLIAYEFGVWFCKYVVGWDWPMPIYGQYFSIDANPAMIIAFIVVSCLFVIVGVNIVYFYLLLKNYINTRVKKTNPV
ncbi:hypothetical protein HK103_001060 [Boothiomyces macroporosus]|uniref:Uncharacterized protein n=1 Tax=Boothiomyces macroporosus TaxID=261099 RepID=A0AAD5UBN3_9FUNG|nr:hypothetical protein HK103_001060 [Boothiomyces macroporosus]